MKIRQFNELIDKKRIIEFLIKVYKELNPGMTMNEEQFDAMLKVEGDQTNPSQDCLVVEDDNAEIVGFAGLLKSTKRDYWRLEIALLSEYFKSNLSVKLFESILNLAKKQKGHEIRFTTRKDFFVDSPIQQKFKDLGLKPVNYNWDMRLDKMDSLPQSNVPPGIILRKQKELNDLTKYIAVLNDAFSDHFDFRAYEEEEFKILQLGAWKEKFNEHWLAFEGNKLIGFCSIVINPTQKNIGIIQILGVFHSYHHRGIGSSLLSYGVQSLLKEGCNIIELTVEAKNEKALNLYKKFGFYELEPRTRIFFTIKI